MFAITSREKENSAKYVKTMINNFMNTSDGVDTLKIITNYVAKTSSKQSELRNIDDKVFQDSKLTAEYLERAMNYMIEAAIESEKSYSTGELAKYFGVSITAINKWIKEGRFKDVERTEKFKQLRIPENTLWRSTQGEFVSVKEIVEMYEPAINISEEEHLKFIKEDIRFFEKKYNGTFEETLNLKENKSPMEETDAREWSYLITKINSFRKNLELV